jgi:hypothetical protein
LRTCAARNPFMTQTKEPGCHADGTPGSFEKALSALATGNLGRLGAFFPTLQVSNLAAAFLDFIGLSAHSRFCFETMSLNSKPSLDSQSIGFNPKTDRKFPSYGFTLGNAAYVTVGVALTFWMAGCASEPKDKRSKEEKELVAAIRLSQEVPENSTAPSHEIYVLRSSPVKILVEREPILDERDVKAARIFESMGNPLIGIEFTLHGRLVLEMATVSHPGMRMAVQSTWTTGKETAETRWIAAPQLTTPIRDGTLTFTPDCSREEATRIVKGLNNVAVKLKNQVKPEKNSDAPSNAEEAIKKFKEER